MTSEDEAPTCFIAMPITTHPADADRYDGDENHWIHILETLFVRAIERAGYRAIPPMTKGSHMIHAEIVKNLSRCDMVLVDLSSYNPNVFFELGLRTALDQPITLVKDEHTTIPFDTGGINTYTYDSHLRGWELDRQVADLHAHIEASRDSCGSSNPLWRRFGLTLRAEEPSSSESPLEAKVQMLTEKVELLYSGGLALSRLSSARDEVDDAMRAAHDNAEVAAVDSLNKRRQQEGRREAQRILSEDKLRRANAAVDRLNKQLHQERRREAQRIASEDRLRRENAVRNRTELMTHLGRYLKVDPATLEADSVGRILIDPSLYETETREHIVELADQYGVQVAYTRDVT